MTVYRKEWTFTFEVCHQEALAATAEAFFCSYQPAEYTLTCSERYRIEFRRGKWICGHNGSLSVPSSSKFRIGDWTTYPFLLRVLFRPTQEGALITLKHEVVTPVPLTLGSIRGLSAIVGDECEQAKAYFDSKPTITDQTGFDRNGFSSLEKKPPQLGPEAAPTQSLQPTVVQSMAPIRQAPDASPKETISPWWPSTPAGTALLFIWLAATFIVALVNTGGSIIDGIAALGVNYLIIITARYVFLIIRN